jgi:hypothetical protein
MIVSIWDQLCRSCCLLVAQISHTGLHSGSKQHQQQQQDSWFVVTGWLPEGYVQAPNTSLARRWSICNILGWWARIKMCRTMHTTPNHQEQHYCNKRSECSNENCTSCLYEEIRRAPSPLVGAIILQLHHTLLQLTTCKFFSTFTWVQEQKQTPQRERERCSRLPPQCHCLQLLSFFPSLCFVIKPESFFYPKNSMKQEDTTFNSSERFYPGKIPWIFKNQHQEDLRRRSEQQPWELRPNKVLHVSKQ